MKIFINPGHSPNGRPDPGACNFHASLQEADVAANVGVLVSHYLNAVGIATQILQSDSLGEICRCANVSGADYFISVHCNSAASERANGTETWYCHGSRKGAGLAACINRQIVDSMGTADRGIKSARPSVNGLYVLTNTDMPAVLVEIAFISNVDDAALIADRQDGFARAIARGVTDFLSEK